MKKEELEKLVSELSPEMQEKARQCKDMKELNTLLAENEIELSEGALQAVAGGCSASSKVFDTGDLVDVYCPECGNQLRYWDMLYEGSSIFRLYCDNPSCSSYNNGLWAKKDGVRNLYKYK